VIKASPDIIMSNSAVVLIPL